MRIIAFAVTVSTLTTLGLYFIGIVDKQNMIFIILGMIANSLILNIFTYKSLLPISKTLNADASKGIFTVSNKT